jgi:hypothetical protein
MQRLCCLVPGKMLRDVKVQDIALHFIFYILFFNIMFNFIFSPMPPHVPYGLRGLPS